MNWRSRNKLGSIEQKHNDIIKNQASLELLNNIMEAVGKLNKKVDSLAASKQVIHHVHADKPTNNVEPTIEQQTPAFIPSIDMSDKKINVTKLTNRKRNIDISSSLDSLTKLGEQNGEKA